MRRAPVPLALAALLYGAMALAANAALALTPTQRAEIEALRAGEMAGLAVRAGPMPRIEAPFRDLEGDRLRLSDYAGKVVLLNLWATWCAPCRAEMPALDRLAGDMAGPDLAVIPLSVDRAGGDEKVSRFLGEIGTRHLEVMRDPDGDFLRLAGAFGLPVTLILDRQGREIARMIGDADWDSPEARRLIRRVIEMTGPAAPTVRT